MSTSQTTLVNPSPPAVLVFTKNSVKSATILYDSNPLYTITTDLRSGSKTTVTDSGGCIVAVIQRREFFSDTVSFPQRDDQKLKLSKWLVKETGPDGVPVHTIDTSIGACSWRNDPSARLSLHPANFDASALPWATLRLEPSLHLSIDLSKLGVDKDPSISFSDPIARSFVEDVIVSVIILELQLRMQDKSYHVADGMVVENRTVLGYQVVA